jgi:hypothetical protein
MNESRNRFFITAVAIVVAIAFFRAMSKGRLPGFLLEQGLIFLVAGTVIAAFVLTDRFLRKRHSGEWMTRYYKWIFGVIGAAGLIFFGTVFRRAGLEAKREGEFGEFALALLSIAVVIGTIVGMDMFFRKRRSEQWMTGFRIYMALAVVALIVGLGAYLLAGPPK